MEKNVPDLIPVALAVGSRKRAPPAPPPVPPTPHAPAHPPANGI